MSDNEFDWKEINEILNKPNFVAAVQKLNNDYMTEQVFNVGYHIINSIIAAISLQRLSKSLHKTYPAVPILSFKHSLMITGALFNAAYRATDMYRRMPSQTTYSNIKENIENLIKAINELD